MMFRAIAFCFSFLLTVTPAFAQGSDPSRIIDKEALRQSIYDGDIVRVENVLIDAQKMYASGDATPDDMRIIYQIFTTTNPKVINFTERWLRKRPESPYAHAAQAWIYFTSSWIVRGDKMARQTYPLALDEFSRMQDLGWDHAMRAYEAIPTFVPASDALLRMAVQTGQHEAGYQVLHDIMKAAPDMGTLTRGLEMTRKGWGGHWHHAEWVCNTYARKIEWEDQDPHHYCLTYAALAVHPGTHADWGYEQIETGDFSDLEYMRLNRATWHNATRADAEWARDYLNREGVTNYHYAYLFDENVAVRYGFDFISHEHLARQQEHARALLEHDPYDPGLLDILSKSMNVWTREDGNISLRHVSRPSEATLMDLAQRRLIVAPYDPDNWRAYLGVVGQGLRAESFQRFEAFAVNAVVYANHQPGAIQSYLLNKAEAYMRLDWTAAGKMDPEWDAVLNRVNEETVILCPIVRAYRLRQLVCETRDTHGCTSSATYENFFSQIMANVEEDGQCFAERTAEPYELFFEPVLIDFDDYPPGKPG